VRYIVAPDAELGPATINVHTPNGDTSYQITIVTSLPLMTSINPPQAPRGETIPMTIIGVNLEGATLTTTWPGLTISDVSSQFNGSQLNATFSIAANAPTGQPSITATTAQGSNTKSNLFTIYT